MNKEYQKVVKLTISSTTTLDDNNNYNNNNDKNKMIIMINVYYNYLLLNDSESDLCGPGSLDHVGELPLPVEHLLPCHQDITVPGVNGRRLWFNQSALTKSSTFHLKIKSNQIKSNQNQINSNRGRPKTTLQSNLQRTKIRFL